MCLTFPPVTSANLPISTKRQSVPSKVITDIMTLEKEKKVFNLSFLIHFILCSNKSMRCKQVSVILIKPSQRCGASTWCPHICFMIQLFVSSPFRHSLQSQVSIEIWRLGKGRRRGRLRHLTESDVGSAVSAQNDLQNAKDAPKSYCYFCRFGQHNCKDGIWSSLSLTSSSLE